MTSLWALALVGVGLFFVVAAVLALLRWRSDRRVGALVSVDSGRGASATLRSERYRLSGRPDIVRRRADGRPVPIEIKSREAFSDGPPRSHILQLWAYCLLLEETDGRAPPYGILRYGDGVEYRVPWGREERAILLDLLGEMALPYDGRARPAPARCAHCRWWAICDARAGTSPRGRRPGIRRVT